MKKLVLLLICMGCGILHAQRKPKIKGNKSVIEVREELPAFNRIEVRDDLEISIQKSSDPGYTITADDNLIDILKFEVVDSTLVISAFYTITAKKKLDISVRFKELTGLRIDNAKVMGESTISADQLEVFTSGTARADLQISASVAIVEMEGNSKAQLNIDADSLSVLLIDKVDTDIYVTGRSSTLEMQGNALADVGGMTEELDVKLGGSTKLRAQGLEATNIHADIMDTSSARLRSTSELHLTSSNSAKLFLYGDPAIVIKEFSGSSELYKRSD